MSFLVLYLLCHCSICTLQDMMREEYNTLLQIRSSSLESPSARSYSEHIRQPYIQLHDLIMVTIGTHPCRQRFFKAYAVYHVANGQKRITRWGLPTYGLIWILSPQATDFMNRSNWAFPEGQQHRVVKRAKTLCSSDDSTLSSLWFPFSTVFKL